MTERKTNSRRERSLAVTRREYEKIEKVYGETLVALKTGDTKQSDRKCCAALHCNILVARALFGVLPSQPHNDTIGAHRDHWNALMYRAKHEAEWDTESLIKLAVFYYAWVAPLRMMFEGTRFNGLSQHTVQYLTESICARKSARVQLQSNNQSDVNPISKL